MSRNRLSQVWTLLYLLSAMLVLPGVKAEALQPVKNVIAPKASKSLLLDIAKLDSGRLIAVGERGHVLISDDDGDSWKQIVVPTNTLLTRLFFVNDQIGWAVGHERTIMKTVDGGDSWILQNWSDDLDQPALFDIWFENENKGFAVGAYGLYLETQDGGETWQERYVDSLEDEEIGFPHFYAVEYDAEANTLLMAGELGFIAISKDKGSTWQKSESPYQGSFFDAAISQGDWFVLGLRGHVFRSGDKGKSWVQVETNTTSGLQRLIKLRGNRLLIVGSDGIQLMSSDNGRTFKKLQRGDRVHLASAVRTRAGNLVLVGEKGIIKSDIDG